VKTIPMPRAAFVALVAAGAAIFPGTIATSSAEGSVKKAENLAAELERQGYKFEEAD
jgi:hypothetical protein